MESVWKAYGCFAAPTGETALGADGRETGGMATSAAANRLHSAVRTGTDPRLIWTGDRDLDKNSSPGGPARNTALACALLALVPAVGVAGPVDRAKVEAALPRLEAMAQDMVDAGEAPGIAIGVVHDDAVVWLEGFGLREAGKPDPVDADTVFQIASMSKAISATVVAALVGKGVLDWGTRVADLDPAFALHDPYPTAEVTVRDFFNHRSGLPGSAGNDLEQIGYRPGDGDGAPAAGSAVLVVPRRLCLFERRDHRGGARGRASDGQGLGDGGGGRALHAARHGLDELPLRCLRRAGERLVAAHARGRCLGGADQVRSDHPGAGRGR